LHQSPENYEGSLEEVLTLQNRVASAVAREIQIQMTPRERTLLATPRAVDPAAYEAYMKGRYLLERGSEENLRKSQDYFEQAIKKDPGYALAWAGLADTYDKLASWGVVSRQDSAPRARAAAEKALKLDNSLAGEDAIAFNAGTHRDVVHMKMVDYRRLVKPTLVSLAREPAMRAGW